MPEAEARPTPELNRVPAPTTWSAISPNLLRDEWVNIGILLFDPAERPGPAPPDGRARRFRPRAPAAPAGRRGPAAAAARRFRGAVRRREPATAWNSWPAWSRRFPMPCSSARKKACWPRTWTPNSTGSTAITSSRRATAAGPRTSRRATPSALAPTKCFAPPASGRAWSAACASRSSPTRATPCAWTTPTAATAREDSCRRLPLGRDPGQAKVLAFTADAIRAKLAKTEFLAVTRGRAAPAGKCAAPVRHRAARGTRNSRRAAGAPGGMGASACGLPCSRQRQLAGANPTDSSAARYRHPLQNFLVPGFQAPLHLPMNWCADGAVHDAVVVAQASDRPWSEWRWHRRPPPAASESRRWPEWPRSAD